MVPTTCRPMNFCNGICHSGLICRHPVIRLQKRSVERYSCGHLPFLYTLGVLRSHILFSPYSAYLDLSSFLLTVEQAIYNHNYSSIQSIFFIIQPGHQHYKISASHFTKESVCSSIICLRPCRTPILSPVLFWPGREKVISILT